MAHRTQVYLSDEQRARIDEVRRRDGKSLAAVVREALDAYLDRSHSDSAAALEATFGVAPDFAVPSRGEWGARERRGAGG